MSSWDTNPRSNFCEPHWELICRNKWHPGTSKISTPPEITVVTHFHTRTSHWNYLSIFTSWWTSLLFATSKFDLLTIRRQSATRKHLFPYLQGNSWGVRKPKKDNHQHYHQRSSPYASFNWSNNKARLLFNQTNMKRWSTKLVDVKS